jgi:hypothetical protein
VEGMKHTSTHTYAILKVSPAAYTAEKTAGLRKLLEK